MAVSLIPIMSFVRTILIALAFLALPVTAGACTIDPAKGVSTGCEEAFWQLALRQGYPPFVYGVVFPGHADQLICPNEASRTALYNYLPELVDRYWRERGGWPIRADMMAVAEATIRDIYRECAASRS